MTARRWKDDGLVGPTDNVPPTHPSVPPNQGGASTRKLTRSQMDPFIGEEMGGCKIESKLGKGGMATVYLGKQLGLDRQVAIKILHTRYTQSQRQIEQFFREAKTLARLEHPNIVGIYGVGNQEETPFLVMQLVRGGSLHKLIRERGRLPVPEAVELVKQIGRGLREAHAQGVVHRDVKPGNVLVSPGPQMKLTDFGLALMNDGSSDAFSKGRVVGTPHYMSPEQVDAREVDHRTDIYALGATLYHMMCGKPPYQADSAVELLVKHVSERLTPPHERCPDIPKPISRVVCKMMAKNPTLRYQSMGDVLEALDAPQKAPKEEKQEEKEEANLPLALLGQQALPDPVKLLKPVRAKQPPTVIYGAVALMLITALAAVGLMQPLQEVLGGGQTADQELDATEETARVTWGRLQSEGKGLEPEDRLERYRAFAENNKGTEAGDEALAAAGAIETELSAAAEEKVAEALRIARNEREEGRLGPAIKRLSDLDPALVDKVGKSEEVETQRGEIASELARLRLAWVPAGKFRSGERSDFPFLEGFYIDVDEVTCGEYAAALEWKNPPAAPEGTEWSTDELPERLRDVPVTGITPKDAMRYAEQLGMRLPTNRQWEKAARGFDGNRWPWGDRWDSKACNWGAKAGVELAPRRSFSKDKSPFGCHDLAGNASEFVRTRRSTAVRPKIWVRGGSVGTTEYQNTRSAFYIDGVPAETRHPLVGFRCVIEGDRIPAARRKGL